MKNYAIRVAGIILLFGLVLVFGQDSKRGFNPYKMFDIVPGGFEQHSVYKFQDYNNTCYIATGSVPGYTSGFPIAISCIKDK